MEWTQSENPLSIRDQQATVSDIIINPAPVFDTGCASFAGLSRIGRKCNFIGSTNCEHRADILAQAYLKPLKKGS
jgi:hypothetical protein